MTLQPRQALADGCDSAVYLWLEMVQFAPVPVDRSQASELSDGF